MTETGLKVVNPHGRIPSWPTSSWLMGLGKGKHFLTFPVRAGQLINYVGFVPADEKMKESWSAPGDPVLLRRAFAGWDPRIGSLLTKVSATFRWLSMTASHYRPGVADA